MSPEFIKPIFLIIFLTIISGFADAQGFTQASNIWSNGRLNTTALSRSALGFSAGIFTYWLIIRYLQQLGIVSSEIQTILWFSATIIGVAILSGKFVTWQRVDQLIAIFVIAGVGWLIFRTSGG